jgi:hypothetical protein
MIHKNDPGDEYRRAWESVAKEFAYAPGRIGTAQERMSREILALRNELAIALKFLEEGKAKFAPNTTNSRKESHEPGTCP